MIVKCVNTFDVENELNQLEIYNARIVTLREQAETNYKVSQELNINLNGYQLTLEILNDTNKLNQYNIDRFEVIAVSVEELTQLFNIIDSIILDIRIDNNMIKPSTNREIKELEELKTKLHQLYKKSK